MNNVKNNFLRITALWAFSEAFLGGILHAFQFPFTGLFLSAFAAICMSAIAIKDYKRGRLLKATLLVLIVKAMLSPHTPVTAYFAVGLQGLFAEIIFSVGITYRIASFLLAIFTLMQSAFQKLIILTVLFGMEFWKAIDEFLNSVLTIFGVVNYSQSLVMIYLGIYLLMGILTGIFAARLPDLLSTVPQEALHFEKINIEVTEKQNRRMRFLKNPLFWLMFIFLLFALYQAYSGGDLFVFAKSKAGQLVIRAILVLGCWYYFISPLLLKLFKNWISKRKSRLTMDVEEILNLLPEIRSIVGFAFQKTSGNNILKRIKKIIAIIFYLLLNPGNES